jgi:hypothetical protein
VKWTAFPHAKNNPDNVLAIESPLVLFLFEPSTCVTE